MGALRISPKVRQARRMINQAKFLAVFASTGQIKRAAAEAQIGVQTHFSWLHHDPEYATKFFAAKQEAVELLEAECYRRAVDGVEEPIYQQGQLVGHKLIYSDGLAMFLLKGLAKDRYKERIETENKNVNLNAGMQISLDASKLTAEELRNLEVIMAKLMPAQSSQEVPVAEPPTNGKAHS